VLDGVETLQLRSQGGQKIDDGLQNDLLTLVVDRRARTDDAVLRTVYRSPNMENF
jgi:hypothetical protein